MQKNVTVLDTQAAREHVMPEATFEILMSMPGSKDKYKLVSAPAPEPKAAPAPEPKAPSAPVAPTEPEPEPAPEPEAPSAPAPELGKKSKAKTESEG